MEALFYQGASEHAHGAASGGSADLHEQ